MQILWHFENVSYKTNKPHRLATSEGVCLEVIS